MKAKLAKLIDVKSIMTLLLTLGFFILAMCGVISGSEYLTIFTMIVGFYFGTQSNKKGTETKAPQGEPVATVADVADNPVKTVEDSMVQEIHPPDRAEAVTE